MEVSKKAVTASEQLTLKTVDLYINAQLISLEGNWEWDMNSEAVYCSDVIMALPPDYVGTKGIVHPDDIEKLKQQLLLFSTIEFIDIDFRMITTYNEVRNISGKNCRKIEVNELKLRSPVKELLVRTASQVENETGLESFHNVKQTTDFAEQLIKTATWYTNTDTHETYYSDNVFRMHGLTPQSLNPHLHSFTHFIHPDDAGPVNDAFDAAYKNQVPIFLEYRIITSGGREKFISLTTKWAHNFKGELLLSGLLQDLTDTREKEHKIEQAESDVQFQKALLQFNELAGNTGYWQINLVTRQAYYSDNYYRMHGLKPQSIPAGANVFNNYIHPDDREKVIEAFKKVRKEHIAPDLEYCILRADGKIRHVVQKGQLISYGGELVMTGTIRDITQQKNLEQQLTEQKEEGLLKEIGYSETEQAVGISSWVQDMQTGDIFWSDNMYNFLGFRKTVKELTFPQLLKTILPEHRKNFMDEIAVAIETGAKEMECSILRNGKVHNIKAVFKIVIADDKRFFTATLQDVTGHHLLQHQLFESAQLNQLLAENILDCVFITDINNKIILWNRKCEQYFTLKNEEVEERNYFDVFPQHKTETIINRFNAVLNGDTVHERNERTGINEFHDLNMTPLRDRDGKVIGILHVLHDVTKEYQLRNNLTERLHFIEKLMEETVDRIVVLDRNLNYTYWNKKAEEHYHVNQEYVIGKNVLEIFPGIINKPLYHHLKKALKGETIYIGSSKLEKWEWNDKQEWIWEGEGEGEYIETYLIPMLNTRNEVTSILWIVHDLTKEVQLQKTESEAALEIKRSKDLLNSVFNASLNGIILFKAVRDEKGEIKDYEILLNNTVTQSWNGNDLTGKLYCEEFPQVKQLGIFDAYNKVLQTGEPIKIEVLFKGKNKSWYNISAVKLTEDELVATAEDITDSKKAEEDLKESKELLQQTTLATPDSITVYDLEKKKPLYLNSCLSSWVGYSNQELIKMSFEERLELIHPNDRDKLINFNTELTATTEDKTKTLEYKVQSREGRVLWLKNRSKPFRRNAEGKVTHILSVLQDITETKNIEAALEHQRDRLIEAQRIGNLGNFEFNVAENSISWSDELYKIYGLPNTELITPERVIELTHPDDKELVTKYVKDELKAGEMELTHKIIRADGAVRVVNRRIQSIADENGEVFFMKGTVQDITNIFLKDVAQKATEQLQIKKMNL